MTELFYVIWAALVAYAGYCGGSEPMDSRDPYWDYGPGADTVVCQEKAKNNGVWVCDGWTEDTLTYMTAVKPTSSRIYLTTYLELDSLFVWWEEYNRDIIRRDGRDRISEGDRAIHNFLLFLRRKVKR